MKFSSSSVTLLWLSTSAVFFSTPSNAFMMPSATETHDLHVARMIPPPVETTAEPQYSNTIITATAASTTTTASSTVVLSSHAQQWLRDNDISIFPQPAFAAETVAPPTNSEIELLRSAFAAFYGINRDVQAAEPLLTQSIQAWERQAPDEKAGLYRVRGDCYMVLLKPLVAIQDYTTAITFLQGPEGERADPTELPSAVLGRARAIRSLSTTATKEQALQGVQDYETTLKMSSREEWDTDQELLEDGARTNPYATWEYGMALRLAGNTQRAQQIHTLASQCFDEIGDPARAVISAIDAGIDASDYDSEKSITLIKSAFEKIKAVEGRDIPLLQRVIAKEGEGRVALASIYWTNTDGRQEAESQLGLACQRLDQLEADAIARQKVNPKVIPPRLKFNIDDGVGALDISCSRLRNKEYLNERLEWPKSLQQKVDKLYSLSK